MSQREMERAGVIAEVAAGWMRQVRAEQTLGLPCRQVKRLVQAWRRFERSAGLRSKRRGRLSNRRYSDALRQQVLAFAAERYDGFGPTLLGEYLAREYAVAVSTKTPRQWLMQAGRWRPRSDRHAVHRARSRRPRFGKLVQIDGSPHGWIPKPPCHPRSLRRAVAACRVVSHNVV